ncbi:MAG: hypothetical protein J7M09_05760 [Deltaproteobacteria bacterium]|nr:hypothetical protein [Candidatus Tharpella sp.]
MTKRILLLSLMLAFLISGCGWKMPFFGSEKVQEEEPLVQEAVQTENEPQYSGQNQSNTQNQYPNPYQAPAANQYGQAPAYGQMPGAAPGAFQPGQPYNPNANYALNANPGYGGAAGAYGAQNQNMAPQGQAYGAQPYGAQPYSYYGGNGAVAGAYGQGQMPGNMQPAPAYGAYPTAQPMNAMNNNYGGGFEQSNLGRANSGAAPDSFFGTPPEESFAFSGIKRKTLFIISYPQRGLTTTPHDAFSQQIYQRLAAAPGINLVPSEAVDHYTSSQQFYSQTLDSRARLSRLGMELGAQAIILERVHFSTNFNAGVYAAPTQQIELQLIDTATGYPVKSYNLNPSTPGSGQVVSSLVNYVRMIDWSARVIKVENKRILINAGRLSGLQAGQNLRIYAKASEIKDPSSKISLGQAQGALKGSVKIVDFFGLDGAICEPLAAGKFKSGDMVKAVE